MKPRLATVLHAALIAAAGWWVFSPAIHGGWVWDDTAEVAENPALRDPAGLARIWIAPAGPDYYPLKTTVQWAAWRLWGGSVEGYHALNLALHVLAGLLLWRLLARLRAPLPWVGGLLFVVHPLAVSSVAWISELKNTLSLPLLLGSALAYLAYDDASSALQGRLRPYILSLLLFLAAILAKASVVMFPFVLLLHAWWRRGRVGRRDLLASAPFFAISIVLGLVTLHFQTHRALAGTDIGLGGFLPRMAAAGLAMAHYLSKAAVPTGLRIVYPKGAVDPASPMTWMPWLALAGILAFLLAKRMTYGRHALFGLGFFLITLLPVLGFMPMSFLRIARVGDHLAYLPLAGFAGLAAAGLGAGCDRLARRGPGRAGPLWAVRAAAAAAVALLACESRGFAAAYGDSEAFWRRALDGDPGSWLPHNGYGLDLAARGRLPEALAQLAAAARLGPGIPEAHVNYGNALFQAGRFADAAGEYTAALEQGPPAADTLYNLGNALLQAGKPSEAVAAYVEAVKLDPRNPLLRHNLGMALFASGRMFEGRAQLEEEQRLRSGGARHP
jgi:tetratricopeptide (TPR) repeat protein